MSMRNRTLDPDSYEALSMPRSERANERQRKRAATERHAPIKPDEPLASNAIIFPPPEGCRHAALVVCGYFSEDPEAAREVLAMLALPLIMREGGDGRKIREQKRPPRTPKTEPTIGYSPDDWGRPPERRSRG